MAVKGVITRLIPGKDFFFIDKDYFCHFSKVSFEPQIGMEVEYEQAQNRDGKPEARNVKPIGKIVSSTDFFSQYLDELNVLTINKDGNEESKKLERILHPLVCQVIYNIRK